MIEFLKVFDGNPASIFVLGTAALLVWIFIMGVFVTLVVNVFTRRRLSWNPFAIIFTGIAYVFLKTAIFGDDRDV